MIITVQEQKMPIARKPKGQFETLICQNFILYYQKRGSPGKRIPNWYSTLWCTSVFQNQAWKLSAQIPYPDTSLWVNPALLGYWTYGIYKQAKNIQQQKDKIQETIKRVQIKKIKELYPNTSYWTCPVASKPIWT